ncbi:MAG: helix-turn-helix domain-containing protein, partial [Chloroflexi bacterium]|nr:helix-turn-helix domain-containing protein [Chloroflexota bacterium]
MLLRHRGRTGLTQRQLAARVGVNRRALQAWEASTNCPSVQRLQSLIVALIGAGGMNAGHEVDEAQELWTAAERETTRTFPPFDNGWFARLVADRTAPGPRPERVASAPAAAPDLSLIPEWRWDWGDAPDVRNFVGRAEALATVRHWVLDERCHLISVLGMGGIGKTSFAAELARELAPAFRRIYWRGLRNAPPVGEWLPGAIGFLSGHRRVPPRTEAERLDLVLELLREEPSLLVLDNFETVLEPGRREGRYREGFGGYDALLRAVGQGRHESCLVITGREAPPELATFEGVAVRSFTLGGLNVAEGRSLLVHKQLIGDEQAWTWLVARYGGNGLALKVVGESIRELFGGEIGAFLAEAGASSVFGDIRRLLADQVARCSALEQRVLRVLAVAREPVALAELLGELSAPVGRGEVLEAVGALRRRSLVQRAETPGAALFALQSMVLEYVTDRLVETVAGEICQQQPEVLVEQPLIKAQAPDYVREMQERLIGAPILQQLSAQGGGTEAEPRLLALLDGWRGRSAVEQRFGPGNVVNLLRLHGNLRGMNLAQLKLRQVYLQGIDAQDVSLADASLVEAVLDESFAYPTSVALSADGSLLAAGTPAGEVRLWRATGRTLLLAVPGHTGMVWRVTLSRDGKLAASAGDDGTVKLWHAASGQVLSALHGHAGAVWGLALSADGQLVASGGADGTVRLWRATGGQLLATLRGHVGVVRGVDLSRDGRLLISGGDDGSVKLWETGSGGLLRTLPADSGAVRGVALSGAGHLAASGGADGTVR